jgi:hypothetical protein
MMGRKKETQQPLEHLELSSIMGTANGRNVIRRILINTGVFGNAFDVNDRQHAYNEGRRSVGVALINELKEVAPDTFQLLLREHFNG